MSTAPTWPAAHRDDPCGLRRLIRRGTVIVEKPDAHWIVRLGLRRLLFAAVLVAPSAQGGLGLNRKQALHLTPKGLQRERPRIGTGEGPSSCPACATWSWLQVLGTNSGWSHSSVRELSHRRDEPRGGEHRHTRPDASPEWHDCVGLLPAIDRWGYVDPYDSMHPSSLSVLVTAMEALLDAPVGSLPALAPALAPARPVRQVSPEEQQQIFDRADELSARIATILAVYS